SISYEICQSHENLQVKKFNTFSISFPSNSYRENSKHHYKKNRMCHVSLDFKGSGNCLTNKILKICYYSKNINHGYLNISPSYSDSKIIRTRRHNFFLLAFEVQILTKIRQNHEYLPLKHKPPFSPTTGNYTYSRLTNHLRSKSFFIGIFFTSFNLQNILLILKLKIKNLIQDFPYVWLTIIIKEVECWSIKKK
ncbi:hypothetical protein AGLY_003451, partial [Aphis glycines]